jgi:hypothetical protein
VSLKSALPLLLMLSSLQKPACSWAQSSQTFASIGLALQGIRETFSVSTGFENVTGDLDKAPVTIDLSGNNVARVFDSLVAQRPAYLWMLKDGVYDLYPKNKDISFVRLSVASYVVTDATFIEAMEAIDKSPNIQKWLSRHNTRRANLITGRGLMQPRGVPPPDRRPRVSLALKSVQVLTILNEAYSKLGGTHWVVWHEAQDVSIFFSP